MARRNRERIGWTLALPLVFAAALARPGLHGQVPASQSAPAGPATALIVGQLVDGSSGSPVSSAMITLWPPNVPVPMSGDGVPTPGLVQRGAGAALQPIRILTDANGRFVFHSLAAGSYALGAAHPNYLSSYLGQTTPQATGAGRRLELSEGERAATVVMKIWKFGSISGVIQDEAGDPAVGASIRLVIATPGAGGARQYRMIFSAVTDDRGIYRFGSLAPADYLVVVPGVVASVPLETAAAYLDEMATGPGGAATVRTGVTSSGGSLTTGGTKVGDFLVQPLSVRVGLATPLIVGEGGRTFVYPTTFYPAGRTIASATLITLRSGDERGGVNIAVRPVPAARVSGVVIGSEGPVANMTVKLAPVGAENLQYASTGAEIAQTITRADGTFTAIGVPAGDYIASVVRGGTADVAAAAPPGVAGESRQSGRPAGEQLLWGKTPVSVSASDVDRVTIRLAPGAIVSGRVEFEAGAIAPPAASVIQRGRILVMPVDGTPEIRPEAATVGPDGSFRTRGAPPGMFTFSATLAAPGWTLKSIVAGGRDLLSQPLDLPGSDLSGVVVTYTDKAGELSGVVTRSADDPDVFVVLMPVGPRAPAQVNVRRMMIATAGADGAYRLTGVLPGDYVMAAVAPAGGRAALQEEQVVALVAKQGTRITLTDREKRSLPVTVTRGK